MGFVDKKQLPNGQFAQYGLDFFTRKDLDFRLIPKDPIVDNFIREPFDILINLNNGNHSRYAILPLFRMRSFASADMTNAISPATK